MYCIFFTDTPNDKAYFFFYQVQISFRHCQYVVILPFRTLPVSLFGANPKDFCAF